MSRIILNAWKRHSHTMWCGPKLRKWQVLREIIEMIVDSQPSVSFYVKCLAAAQTPAPEALHLELRSQVCRSVTSFPAWLLLLLFLLRSHCCYLCYLFLVHLLATSSRKPLLAACYLRAPSLRHLSSPRLCVFPAHVTAASRSPPGPVGRRRHERPFYWRPPPFFSPSCILTQARCVTAPLIWQEAPPPRIYYLWLLLFLC